jgi:hypothetical protein
VFSSKKRTPHYSARGYTGIRALLASYGEGMQLGLIGLGRMGGNIRDRLGAAGPPCKPTSPDPSL